MHNSQLIHDSQIVSYSVDFRNKTLSIQVYLEKKDQYIDVVMQDVLTHQFEDILTANIILDIEEDCIDHFIDGNIKLLESRKNYCWPILYENIDELKDYLLQNRYKYINIYSSFGLCGMGLAKRLNFRSE